MSTKSFVKKAAFSFAIKEVMARSGLKKRGNSKDPFG
jgi:hypothetical protein